MGYADVPLAQEMARAMQLARQAREDLERVHLALRARIQATPHGDVDDDELAAHQLFLDRLEEVLEAALAQAKETRQACDRRTFYALVANDRFELERFGYKLSADGGLLPSEPKANSPERAELLAWLAERAAAHGSADDPDHPLYAGVVEVKLDWRKLKKLVEKLAEVGQAVPHVKLYADPRVKVTKLAT